MGLRGPLSPAQHTVSLKLPQGAKLNYGLLKWEAKELGPFFGVQPGGPGKVQKGSLEWAASAGPVPIMSSSKQETLLIFHQEGMWSLLPGSSWGEWDTWPLPPTKP